MEIQEIQIKTIGDMIQIPAQNKNFAILDLIAKIENDRLTKVYVNKRETGTGISLIPDNVYTDDKWEYLEKLTKFLNEILKLRKK
ncbi:unnamed protein product [marine sediment metagenome]|uniref:Uncharacterized protein n=1 Tax=marine sediment metagenome TaxID=412755 RepID=X1GGR7_9ZZZZ